MTIDKSDANTAAIETYNANHNSDIGFRSSRYTRRPLAEVAIMLRIKKGQILNDLGLRSTAAALFYSLACKIALNICHLQHLFFNQIKNRLHI